MENLIRLNEAEIKLMIDVLESDIDDIKHTQRCYGITAANSQALANEIALRNKLFEIIE